MHTGVEYRPGFFPPAFGTLFAYEAGKKEFPLPQYLLMGAPLALPETSAFTEMYRPFRLGSVWNPIPNLRRNVDSTRDRERATLLLEQNKEWGLTRQQRTTSDLEEAGILGEKILNTPLLKVFNLTEEPEVVRKAYGEGFGESCLLARRLVEVGCPFVEVVLGGWDFDPSWAIPYKTVVPTLDRGMGNLLKDLAEKDLLRETLVVCATEFGKPPFASPQGYWNQGFSTVLAGGALAGGRVYGETSPDRTKSPVSIRDFFATLFKACDLDPDKTYELSGRQMKYLIGGKPVDDLF